MPGYAAFISYAHRYADWVAVLQRNLERCLQAHGEKRPVFLDQVDLGSGRSWVGQVRGVRSGAPAIRLARRHRG